VVERERVVVVVVVVMMVDDDGDLWEKVVVLVRYRHTASATGQK
jgi:hypothetical protein